MSDYNKSSNPFDVINSNLDIIKSLLQQREQPPAAKPEPEFIPIESVIGVYCSKSALYDYVKQKKFRIYKLGNKSFVKPSEFYAAFEPVVI